MRYYVLDAQGNQYGPVDVPTLNQWVRDGRVMPGTQILVESTGKVIQAQMVPGLNLDLAPGIGLNPAAPNRRVDPNMPAGFPGQAQPQQGMQQGPYANYQRSGAFGGVGDVMPGAAEFNRALTCIGFSLLCCLTIAPLGIPLSIAGIVYARKAQMAGHPGPQVATIAGIISLILCIINTLTTIASIGMLQGLTGG